MVSYKLTAALCRHLDLNLKENWSDILGLPAIHPVSELSGRIIVVIFVDERYGGGRLRPGLAKWWIRTTPSPFSDFEVFPGMLKKPVN